MKAVGGLLVAGVAALAVAAVPAAAAPKAQVIKFISSQTSAHDLNTTPHEVVIDDKDTSGNTQVGHDVITCKVNGSKVLGCVFVFSLSKGTITVKSGAGKANTTPANPIITGGTGAYAGAHGTAAFKTLNQAKGIVQVTLTLK
jgi:hypothetical protein